MKICINFSINSHGAYLRRSGSHRHVYGRCSNQCVPQKEKHSLCLYAASNSLRSSLEGRCAYSLIWEYRLSCIGPCFSNQISNQINLTHVNPNCKDMVPLGLHLSRPLCGPA